ncbi:MAG: type II secretion system F family protein [Actinomycetota bacterium]
MAAAAFGATVAVSGWLASLAMAARRDERIRGRLGARPARGTGSSGSAVWLTGLAARRGWPARPVSYVAAWLGAAVGGATFGATVAGPVGLLVGAMGGPLGVEGWLGRRRVARAASAEIQLRDFAVALAAAVRAGLSIRLALVEAARDVDDPLGPVIAAVVRDLESGRPIDAALERIATELDLPDARLLVTSLGVHRRTGGQLPVLLDELSEVVGQRVDARRGSRALTAQGRASGAVLAVLPVAFVALLSGTGGDGLGAFYRTPLGAGLLMMGVLLDAAGFLWIRRIVGRAERSR